MIVSTPVEPLWAWINTRVGIPWSSDFRAIGLVVSDCIVAAVGYNAYVGRTCSMHLAIDDPTKINRTFVRAVFDYPFNVCNCTHVFAMVDSSNKQALELDLHVGFKELTRLDGAGLDGGDLIVLSMRREECRWIKERSRGKEISAPSPELLRSGSGAE